MTQHSNKQVQFTDVATDRVLGHFRDNPFRFHYASWLVVAAPFALLMMPEFSLGVSVGFGISAILFCSILSFVTYPLSGHYSFIAVGALAGVAMVPLGEFLGAFSTLSQQGAQVCLLTGAIIGSTSVIWRIPLQLLEVARKTRFQTQE